MKLRLRRFRARRDYARWESFLASEPALGLFKKEEPDFGEKILRPYLDARYTRPQRTEILIHHYGLLARRNLTAFVSASLRTPTPLWSHVGRSGRVYTLTMSSCYGIDREGEIQWTLRSDGVFLYTATFTAIPFEGRSYIKLSCLKGPCGEDGLERVRAATKDLESWRPRDFMISMVRGFGAILDCDGVFLVANENQMVHLMKRGRAKRFFANYDEMWRDAGAEIHRSGDFHLSCADLLRADFSDTPSHKRAQAKRKVALLSNAFDQLARALRDGGAVDKKSSGPGPELSAECGVPRGEVSSRKVALPEA